MKIRHHLRELWQYRDLTRNLVVRDLKVRYKSSVLGVAWSWLSPLLMMIVYTLFFTIFFNRRDIRHYPVFLLCYPGAFSPIQSCRPQTVSWAMPI